MGIYINIKGMEMPTTCGKCKIKNAIKCNRWELVRSVVLDRHRDCPLVPIPEHGRLIDADALIRDWPTGFVKTADVINNTPTIIPADPTEEG